MNKGLKNLPDPIVRTAIPRAKPSFDFQRVSPGVYRDGSGKLVRSRDGFDPAAKRDLLDKAFEASRDMPKGGGTVDAVQKAAPAGSKLGQWSGSTNATPSGERFLGPTPGAESSRQANNAADLASQLARQFTGGEPQQPSNMDDVINWIQQLTNQRPSREQDMGNAIGEFLASGRQVTPAQRPVGSRAPEAQQVGSSIGEFLRRR